MCANTEGDRVEMSEMPKMRRFSGKDIGAELLSILTSGLYREPFDAVREYVQNGIDAGANLVEITVASNSAIVLDNGSGMSPDVADAAIRLGISNKDPRTQVGFRGIGIYSALHLCDQLIVRTRDEKGNASRIEMDFALIRAQLAEQEAARLKGKPACLWLESMLSGTVSVAADPESPLESHGTLVVLLGLSTDFGDRLKDRSALETYLMDVVPLPFDPDFKWGAEISERLTDKGFTPVSVNLTHDGAKHAMFRPYTNRIFTGGEGVAPSFFDVVTPESRKRLGFCWYCLNDDSYVLPCESVRGLIMKKFGFSVGDRDYMRDLYGRPIVSGRVTGEIIVEDTELLPNAARSDFEAGPARDRFKRALSNAASKISSHATTLQQRWRALDVLEHALQELQRVSDSMPAASGDVDRLLDLNASISIWDQKLRAQHRFIPPESKAEETAYGQLSHDTRLRIRELIETKRAKRPSKVAQIVAALPAGGATVSAGATPSKESPKSLKEVADRLGLAVTAPMETFLDSTDSIVLRPNLSPAAYESGLADLFERLEDQS